MKKKFIILISILVLSIICATTLVACGNKYEKDPIIGNYLTEDGKYFVQIVHCKPEDEGCDCEDINHFKLTNTYYTSDGSGIYTKTLFLKYNKDTKEYDFLSHKNTETFWIAGVMCEEYDGKIVINNDGIMLSSDTKFNSDITEYINVKLHPTTMNTIDEWKASIQK